MKRVEYLLLYRNPSYLSQRSHSGDSSYGALYFPSRTLPFARRLRREDGKIDGKTDTNWIRLAPAPEPGADVNGGREGRVLIQLRTVRNDSARGRLASTNRHTIRMGTYRCICSYLTPYYLSFHTYLKIPHGPSTCWNRTDTAQEESLPPGVPDMHHRPSVPCTWVLPLTPSTDLDSASCGNHGAIPALRAQQSVFAGSAWPPPLWTWDWTVSAFARYKTLTMLHGLRLSPSPCES